MTSPEIIFLTVLVIWSTLMSFALVYLLMVPPKSIGAINHEGGQFPRVAKDAFVLIRDKFGNITKHHRRPVRKGDDLTAYLREQEDRQQ